ncbi:hypothetical protein ABVT39_025553 [Epinephelus coioides]
MADRGLYQKHSLDYPLLKDFATYLEKELCNENFKQEVENVARFLFYADPQQLSLLFVRHREKLRQYLCELSGAKLSKQTQQNYLKSLKRFLVYYTVSTSLRRDDGELHADCKDFIDFIGCGWHGNLGVVCGEDNPQWLFVSADAFNHVHRGIPFGRNVLYK